MLHLRALVEDSLARDGTKWVFLRFEELAVALPKKLRDEYVSFFDSSRSDFSPSFSDRRIHQIRTRDMLPHFASVLDDDAGGVFEWRGGFPPHSATRLAQGVLLVRDALRLLRLFAATSVAAEECTLVCVGMFTQHVPEADRAPILVIKAVEEVRFVGGG